MSAATGSSASPRSRSGSGLDPADVGAAGAEPIDDGIDVEWAAWSHVEVILAGLRRAAPLDPDWVLVLSGQDYPLRPMGEIEADLAASEGDAMLGAVREIESRRPVGDDEFCLRSWASGDCGSLGSASTPPPTG